MADKDKKLRVILKLPSKSSSNSKAGISGASASPGVTSHKVHASSVAGSGTPPKLSAQVASSTANNRVATPPKKRKFKTLVEGDAKDHQGGVCGAAITTITPLVFKAPLPPLAKKSSHKKKEKPLNGEIGVLVSSPGKGEGTQAPAKKVLEGVLDKLKKKDTYGVFSEPVDANLVPDYYDVIKEPMDFGTMYKKISKGMYYTLSLFETDIMLICSNAMRYNGPETIYYKQARSIQDAARKALDVVAGQVGASEAGGAKAVLPKKQPFPIKKGWKNTAAVKTLLDPASSDFASGASLAAEGDDLPQSFKHDTLVPRRGVPSDRSGSVAGEEPGSGAQSLAAGLEPDADVQDELGGQLRPATLKDGRRPLSNDEYHRSSYKPRNLPAHGRGPPLAGVGGELHHLVPTGYQSEMAYARSLSRFSVKLGPEGWKYAAQRLQRVVPLSVPFGQGWIGEHEAPPGTIFRKFPDAKTTNATRINQNLTSTSLPNLPGVSSTSHSPVTSASFVPSSQMSRPLMINPVAQTAMDSLLTTVTSAMLASGAASQALLPGKSTMEPATEKLAQQVQPEHSSSSRGQAMPSSSDGLSTSTGRPLWTSQASANQTAAPTSSMIMQTSDSGNGALSRWTGSNSQAAPTFVYSTAVRTVPTSASMSVGQDEASKAQAHNLELLQADALARAKMQSNVHHSQAPRPTQYMQQPMYTNIPPYGMPPGALVRAPHGTDQMLASSQPLPTSKHEVRPLKLASSQPLQLQVGALVNYGLSHTRPLLNPTSALQQIHSSKPPPDLNLQPVDSPSTPQTSSQLNSSNF